MERSESAQCKVLHVSLEQALFGFTLLGCDTVFSGALPTAATPRISWQHLGEETVHRPIVHQTAVPIETGSVAAQKRFGQGNHHQGASAAARRGAERRLPAWHCGIHGIVRCSDSRARALSSREASEVTCTCGAQCTSRLVPAPARVMSQHVPAQVRLAVDLPQAPQGEKAVIEKSAFCLGTGLPTGPHPSSSRFRSAGAKEATRGEIGATAMFFFAARLQSWKWKMKFE